MLPNFEELLTVTTVKVANKEYEIDVDEYLKVDPSDLQNEFTNHTKRIAQVCYGFERQQVHVQSLEVRLKRIYALCDERARSNLALENGGKKPTETMVENTARTSQEYQEHENELLQAREQLGLLKALRDAVLQRRDVLVGLAANYRSELNAEHTMLRTKT